MASVRNLVINILRLTGASNIAAGPRHHGRNLTDRSRPSTPADFAGACGRCYGCCTNTWAVAESPS